MTIENASAWHDPSHAQLVTTKGWKSANDALASYAQLETHVGAPAESLIRLPAADKMDDAFRADVFKRIGYNPSRGPAKPEDYGVAFEGAPDGFGAGVAAIAHKHGIPVEALKEFAEYNTKFGKEYGEKTAAQQKIDDDKAWTDGQAAIDTKLKARFGDKFDDMNKKLGLEAMRVGGFKDPTELEAFERDLALTGRLEVWRNAMADLAETRRESTFHPPGGGGAMSAEQAKAALATKGADKDWVGKALTRGTPEAAENLRLNFLANGGTVSDEEITRLSKGLTAQPSAS